MERKLDHLRPEDREQVESLAQSTGKPIDVVLAELVHDGLVHRRENGQPEPQPGADAQEAAWQRFLEAGVEGDRERPKGHVVDDSRESIYSGRGE